LTETGDTNQENIMHALIFTALLAGAVSGATASEPTNITSEQLQAFRGNFDLEDGKALIVSQRGRKLFAQVDNEPTVELIATGAKSFTASSGKTRLEFEQYPNGNVTGVRLIRTAN
jgi:hypothetical protein